MKGTFVSLQNVDSEFELWWRVTTATFGSFTRLCGIGELLIFDQKDLPGVPIRITLLKTWTKICQKF